MGFLLYANASGPTPLLFGRSPFLPPGVVAGHRQDSEFYPVSTLALGSTAKIHPVRITGPLLHI